MKIPSTLTSRSKKNGQNNNGFVAVLVLVQRNIFPFFFGMMITFVLNGFVGKTIQIVEIHTDTGTGTGTDQTATMSRRRQTTTATATATANKKQSDDDKFVCPILTESEKQGLQQEINDYEKSFRFDAKIKEVKGEYGGAAIHHKAIDTYLSEKVLQPNWSVLELGCAAGKMIHMVESWYKMNNHPHKELVGVELVPGWVNFAKTYFPSIGSSIDVHLGDVTDFTPLPQPHSQTTFDFIMLNDVAEHIQKDRYGCFFQQLLRVTHRHSLIYFHTPNPQAQLAESDQSYENVLPHHYLIEGMAKHGFELVTMEQDISTDAKNDNMNSDTHTMSYLRTNTKCEKNGYPKYYHAIFRRVPPKMHGVFELQ